MCLFYEANGKILASGGYITCYWKKMAKTFSSHHSIELVRHSMMWPRGAFDY